MADKSNITYPDVFEYITDADRITVGVVQVALATRPRIVQAGRQFEVILLMQNASDSPADVTVTLQIPEKDHAGKKGRFIAGQDRLVVGLGAAEVGFAMMPMSTMPDCAVGENYMIGMDIAVKVSNPKANRVRPNSGGAVFNPQKATEEAQKQIEELRKLKFSTQKRGFLRSTVIETPITVMEGKLAKPPSLNPQWISLWTLENQQDSTILLDKYEEILKLKVLPSLKKELVYPPILEKVKDVFRKAGYPLSPIESACVARLMTLILEFAHPHSKHGSLIAGEFDVSNMFKMREKDKKARVLETAEIQTALPKWLQGYMKILVQDERMGGVAPKAIPHFLFDDLLADALGYAFRLVERDSGENLGSDEERAEFADDIIKKLKTKGEMNFSYAYLPLVLGGIIVTDMVLFHNEKLTDIMKDMRTMVEDRESERDDNNEAVFRMSEFVLAQTLKKYGMLDNRI
ncbi:MAG: hypothetical protein MUE54_02950 [Anaerolineae bacterium]|nr:hypothetical protein [Anaerolineae bacterium]